MPTSQAPASTPSPYDALVFDLGGVLVAHDNALRDARLASRCRQPCAPDQVRRIAGEPQWISGRAPIEVLHARLGDELGYAPDWSSFKADWCCHFTLDPSMLAFVERLRQHNRVLLFSNTDKVHWDFLVFRSGGALGLIEAHLSFEMGLAKPSVESFSMVAERAGVRPHRSLFIDDLAVNVEGARQAGFEAEVFVTEAELVGQLAARGVRLG